jgi:hypothetical protein
MVFCGVVVVDNAPYAVVWCVQAIRSSEDAQLVTLADFKAASELPFMRHRRARVCITIQ